mmetsp:Transcript_13383/g.25184  ORF Transcript_13383/g.25184 Transcript_13383/m.25184 type:complete len:211 (+) Transcript_13383:426-1058(+)
MSEIVNLVAQHCLKTPTINEYSVGAMHLFRAVVQTSWNSILNCNEMLEVFCIMYDRHKVWQLMREVLSKPLGHYYFLLLINILYSKKAPLFQGAVNLVSRSVWSRDCISNLTDHSGIVLQALEHVSMHGNEQVIKEVLTGLWHMLAVETEGLTVEWHSIWRILERAFEWRAKLHVLLRGIWQQVKQRKSQYEGSLAEFERVSSLYRSKLS